MKKLIPLLIVLAFISGGLYYQNELIDIFLSSSNNKSSDSSKNAAPPSLPAINFGSPEQASTETNETSMEDSLVENDSLDSVNEDVDLNQDSNENEMDLDVLDNIQENTTPNELESTDTVDPPSLPAFNFGPPASTSPVDVASSELPVNTDFNVKIKTPDLTPQEFKNSFLKFSYPINTTAQSVSLSSVDLNSIEDKLLNLSFFNNQERLSVQDFVADSSNVTDFFKNLTPEKLEIPSVDEAYVVIDVALATKFYIVKSDNIIVLIEMAIDRNYEFIEQIVIPSIESQIL
jgi:hypothetical protein